MTKSTASHDSPRRSRRRVTESGLPQLAAQLPEDFRSPSAVNAFIYSLAVEVTAGRVESRRAAILGYLSQLAIQTLPLLRIETKLNEPPVEFQFISHIPRPKYPPRNQQNPQGEQPATPRMPDSPTVPVIPCHSDRT